MNWRSRHCPNAEIVFDLFHVVATYGREVIDRVSVDQANKLHHDRPRRRVIKSSCWLLLRNRSNLAPSLIIVAQYDVSLATGRMFNTLHS